MGYSLDQYWRMTIFGRDGIIETSYNAEAVKLAKNGNSEVELIAPCEGNPGGYLRSFTHEIRGEQSDLTTEDVLRASYVGLMAQKSGDEGLSRLSL
jgi:hypothetical protein